MMRRIVVPVALLSSLTAANAGPLQTKLCEFQAAQKLPAIPGLQIDTVAASDMAPAIGLPAYIDGSGSLDVAERTLDAAFVILDDKTQQALRSSYRFDAMKQILIEATLPRLAGASTITLSVKAIGLVGKFVSTCVFSSSSAVTNTPQLEE